jgi:diguanylate cyclase (GGDEF)-like protein
MLAVICSDVDRSRYTRAMGRSAWTKSALAGAAIVAIGIVDYRTGPDVGFSLFYLVPIVWSGWRLDRVSSLGLALLASASWIVADLSWTGMNAVSLWNGFTRAGIYVSMALLTARVRADRQTLQALNDRLKQLLTEEQLVARTDALTGLPNRRLFVDELERAIEVCRRTGEPLAVAYLDLNGFKKFNDRLGHGAGDELLRILTGVVAGDLRTGDVAARLGGDEFGILLRHCEEEVASGFALHLQERIKRTLAGERFASVGVSIGVACFDDPPAAPEAVIDHADAAMYCAKAKEGRQVYIMRVPAARPASVRHVSD